MSVLRSSKALATRAICWATPGTVSFMRFFLTSVQPAGPKKTGVAIHPQGVMAAPVDRRQASRLSGLPCV